MFNSLLWERVGGALWGLSLGDAYGMPMEMWPRHTREELLGNVNCLLPGHSQNNISKGRIAGEVTDDSAFTRLICDLLLEDGTVNPHRLVTKIISWLEFGGEKCDLVLGPSTRKAIEDIDRGIPVEEAGSTGRTNGAAMRILPIGIVFDYRDEARFVNEVVNTCMATHYTNLAISAAGAVAGATSCAVRGGTCAEVVEASLRLAECCEKYGNHVSDVRSSARIRCAIDIANHCTDDEAVMTALSETIGTGLPAEESIPTAIALFYYVNGDPMRCASLCANIGGDTDTIGAMACGLCGSISGKAALNSADIDCIRRASRIDWDPYIEKLITLSSKVQHKGDLR